MKLARQVQVSKEYEKIVPPLTTDEYQNLKSSIRESGQWIPIIVNSEYVILDGHHRFKACNELRLEPRITTRIFENKLLEKKFVIECNLKRRHLNDFQKAELAVPLLEIEKELARERQLASLKKGENPPLASSDAKGKTAGKVARTVGLSQGTLERAKKVIELAPEELKDRVRSGKTSINYAYKAVTRIEKKRTAQPIPEGLFSVVLADPPWEYDINTRGSPDDHYDVLTTEKICKIKVPSYKDSILFLWATAPKLKEALQVLEAWGFDYKTHMVWVKDKIGTGYYFRGQHELLLVGRKGNISIPEEKDRPSSVLNAIRTRHSKKPEQVYSIIEKMYPNQKYLELFARNERSGWKTWGNELA